jgi:iron(II)-dependent oxidoreductase
VKFVPETATKSPCDGYSLDAATLRAWYTRTRARSRQLFSLLTDDAYYSQPIALRHPIVFYDGHLPAFSFNTLVKKALGESSIDARLERLFARGIDPDDRDATSNRADGDVRSLWPDRAAVREFVSEADRRVLQALGRPDLDRPGDPLLDHAEAVFTILEHEAMHQETLLYIWHRLPFSAKHRPTGYSPRTSGTVPRPEWVMIPEGTATLGVDRGTIAFGWDNEFPHRREQVPAFQIERDNVTNSRYLEFVDGGGYRDASLWRPDDWAWLQAEAVSHPLFWERLEGKWYWRGMFDLVPLPPAWPVYVTHAEASAFAKWSGTRLPTEGEFQRAAFGSRDGERSYPWGSDVADRRRGVFDFSSWDPEPAGSHPEGASAWGVHDLIGNGWEWTSTTFAGFPGFTPMSSYPEYSADFFDGEHFVMKGASTATARELIRPTFRNWFRGRYPYVYASFRCVREDA